MNVLAVIAVLGLFCVSELRAARKCTQKHLCSCQWDDGTMVDITSLGFTNNTPAFKDVDAQAEGNFYSYYPCVGFTEGFKDVESQAEGNFYSYNPCVGFTEGSCQNAAVCILNPDKTQSVTIGDSATAEYQYDEASDELIVAYSSGPPSSLRLTEVQLVCDTNACTPSMVANGQHAKGTYQLTLTTVCACPNGCSASGPPDNCGSTGSHVTALDMGTMLCILLMIVAFFTTLT